jgi:hypothetical protein
MIAKIKEKLAYLWAGLASRAPFALVSGSVLVVALVLMASVYQGCVKMLNSVSPTVSGQKQHSRQVTEDLCQKCSRVCGGIHVKTVQSNMTPRLQAAECYHDVSGNP